MLGDPEDRRLVEAGIDNFDQRELPGCTRTLGPGFTLDADKQIRTSSTPTWWYRGVPLVDQEAFAHEQEGKDEAEGEAIGLGGGLEIRVGAMTDAFEVFAGLLEEFEEGGVVDEEKAFLPGSGFVDGSAPEPDHRQGFARASPRVPRGGGEVFTPDVVAIGALDKRGDIRLAGQEVPAGGGAASR